MGKTFCIVGIIVAGQAAVDGLSDQRDQVVADITARTTFLEVVVSNSGKAQGIIKLSEGQQSSVGCDGGAMDYATATVMLARAARLSARLAIGYLPGIRDPLSGAYRVRRGDAHVWAEVHFAESGWVPFDSSPRSSLLGGGTAASGTGFVLRAGVGDAVLESVKSAPTNLFSGLRKALGNPVFSLILAVVLLSALVLRWVYSRGTQRSSKSGEPRPYSSRLAGEDRKELLKLYRQLEKLLQRKSGLRRQPWHTVAAFTTLATPQNEPIQSQLHWFIRAVWHAAYNPAEIPAGPGDGSPGPPPPHYPGPQSQRLSAPVSAGLNIR